MGGYSWGEDRLLAEAEVYDPKADGWQPLPSMPTARSCLAAAAVAGKVYAIGGYDVQADADRRFVAVEAYDPLSGTWTRVASLSVARSCHTATVVDGKIYVLGGERVDPDDEDLLVTTDRTDAYDPAADNWQQMAAMPTSRSSHAAAVLDGKIYVTGGYTSSGQALNAVEAYDPVADTWTTLASLSTPGVCHASAVVCGKLYVFGGRDSSTWWRSHLVEVYSPESNSWARVADLPSATFDSFAVAL